MLCKRRTVLAAIAAVIGTVPLRGFAREQGVGIRKIGILSGSQAPPPGTPSGVARELRSYGFEEGRNLLIERRYSGGSPDKASAMARELIEIGVEVVLAQGNTSIAAAQQATHSVPIVMAFGIAPVEAGFIKSLARPGGNITGNAFHTPETGAKILDLLREAAPKARRATMLWNPTRPGYEAYQTVLAEVAQKRGVTLEFIGVVQPAGLPQALQFLEARLPDFLFVANDISIETGTPQIADLARRRKLPSIGTDPRWVKAGGLFYYGPDEDEAFTGACRQVARILNGARPQDLPVEQPSKYRFIINARTARAIGFTLTESLQLRADQIIDG